MNDITATLLFLLGFFAGGPLNLCISRIPGNVKIFARPLFPGIRKSRTSYRQWLVSLINGAAYLSIYRVYGSSLQTAGFCVLVSALIVAAFIDYKHKIIPDRIVVFILAAGILYGIAARDMSLAARLAGFFAASVPMCMLAVLSKGGIGGGDIKLMAAGGLYIGWKLILVSLFTAAVVGSAAGILLTALKLKGRKDDIPFGPFLAAGVFVALIQGPQLLQSFLF